MRLKKGYKLREVAGSYMLLPCGEGSVGFNRVFSLSQTAAWLWTALQDRDFDEEDAVSLLLGEYDVDEATARSDVRLLIDALKENGILDD